MPANTIPIFTLTPNIGTARLSAANAARDGSGTVTTSFTAGSFGSRVESVVFVSAQGTAAASSGMVGRLFYSPGGAAPAWRLIQEVAIATVTPSATAIGATQTISFANGLIMPSGSSLGAVISVYAGVQDQFDVIARGGDY